MEHAQQVGTTSGQGGLSVVPKPNPSKHVEWVRSLLKRRMVIRVKDGKYYTGLFSCMDKQGNIILEDAEENTPLNTEPHDYSKKHMSLAFIPVTTHKHIHMESPIGEQVSTRSIKAEKLMRLLQAAANKFIMRCDCDDVNVIH